MLALFHYDFMIRALIAGLIVALTAPLIGTFLVVRRYSLMADTLAHVSLVGIAVSFLLKTAPLITATVVTVLAALAIEELRRSRRLSGESILALVLSGSLAVAIVIFSALRGAPVNLVSFLFGSITTVSPADVWVIAVLGTCVFAAILLLYRRLVALGIDEDVARTQGLPVRRLNLALVVLAAVTISLAARIVGVLLIGALMVIPVLTAAQVARSFRQTLIWAVVLAVIAVLAGLTVSALANLASGGTIIVFALAFFLLSLLARAKN